jgi:hypothetical protein
MTLDQIAIPDALRLQVQSILRDIGEADGVLELTRLGGIAEGFSLALSCSGALPAVGLDALEHLFNRAIGNRMADLRRAG